VLRKELERDEGKNLREHTVQMVHTDMIPDESPWDRGTLMKYKIGIIMAALCFTV
jgi:hypothetical protein